jgi:hypothetical protein
MSSVTIARIYARRLVETEARRSGRNHRDESPATVWSLLYRALKRLIADLLCTLQTQVEREIRREIGALEDELAALAQSPRRLDPHTLAEVEQGLAQLRSSLTGFDRSPAP